jgi:hypothetical protein
MFSANNSTPNFTNGGSNPMNLSDLANIEFGSKILQDQKIITGIEAGIGFLLVDKNKLRFSINGGLNYQKVISNTIQTSLIPYQGDLTNYGIFSAAYEKNHFGYFNSLTALTRLSSKLWIGSTLEELNFDIENT